MVKTTPYQLYDLSEAWLLKLIDDINSTGIMFFKYNPNKLRELVVNPVKPLIDFIAGYDYKKSLELRILYDRLILLVSKDGLITQKIAHSVSKLDRLAEGKQKSKYYDQSEKEIKVLVKEARTKAKKLYKLIRKLSH